MRKTLIAFILTISIISTVKGQEPKIKLYESDKVGGATKSEMFTVECNGAVRPVSADLKWRPVLNKKTTAFEPKIPNEELIERIKAEKLKLKYQTSDNEGAGEKSTATVTPIVGVNYSANPSNGNSPLDNSIAISNGGWIISVANTTIEYDDMTGTTSYFNNLISFINDATITSVCDPVIIYDSGSDRFIFFCQTSPITVNSKIIILFSQTNNPNDGWWRYTLSGNPLINGEGFDYPKLAVSTNELYITGNLFYQPAGTFDQAILYQINKGNGYSGASMNWQYWHNISGSPFTLLPVSFGQNGSYGPGCYLIATDDAGSSSIDLYDLTDDMTGSPSLNHYNVSTSSYSPAADSHQLGTTCLLDNGDCRALSGFYLNGIVHFVFHSDIGTGWNGINYNRLDVAANTNQSATFGLVGSYDYSYPSVASFAMSSTDKSVMINFGRVSTTIYPEVRVVNCDDAMNWSGSTLVKGSSSYVSYTSSTKERWGDYTGISRKHNSSTPSVWVSGSFGTSLHKWNAWNAEIHDNTTTTVNAVSGKNEIKIFPNPIIETFNIEFTINENTNIEINILDLSGKVVKQLFAGRAFQGINTFSFNKANLSDGTYFIVIKNNSNIIKNEKIIVAD